MQESTVGVLLHWRIEHSAKVVGDGCVLKTLTATLLCKPSFPTSFMAH